MFIRSIPVLNKHFQHSMIFKLVLTQKKFLPVIETIYDLDITLAAPRKESFDSLDVRRNRSRNDNLLRTRKQQICPPLLHLRKSILIGSLKNPSIGTELYASRWYASVFILYYIIILDSSV